MTKKVWSLRNRSTNEKREADHCRLSWLELPSTAAALPRMAPQIARDGARLSETKLDRLGKIGMLKRFAKARDRSMPAGDRRDLRFLQAR